MIRALIYILFAAMLSGCQEVAPPDEVEQSIERLLGEMTLSEKIGQLQLLNSPGGEGADLMEMIREGKTGAVLNEERPDMIRKFQKTAVEESRLGIPLLFGRDVIHGFKTIFPINIGLAATFNPELVRQGAEIAAIEASGTGINWNFAPMVDVARDPRWGRMAESFGEDPYLVTRMGLAMMEGFHLEDSAGNRRMISCAKHFAAYGAAEGGRDYNTTSVPEVELWNIYFKPFKALNDAGVSTFMSGFNELNGIPATGSSFLLREILKDRWNFNGFVVSDWASVVEMKQHGYAGNDREAAIKALSAGLDMEMASTAYQDHLRELINTGIVDRELLDDAVRRILRVKFELGLFTDPYADPEKVIVDPPSEHLELAKRSAVQSFVLLKNENNVLPLQEDIKKLAVIGPMADDRYEQLGTWIFDGDTNLSITPLAALRDLLGDEKVLFSKGVKTTRSQDHNGFRDALRASEKADAVVIFAGEESIITGEAHSRAYLDLPGAQNELIRKIASTGKPVVLVIMTPRPLTIGEISGYADAVIYAWHPGTMAGPALADVIFGKVSPSGKLPVTFPKAPGQIPIYYAHKNTGRPPDENSFVPMDEIPVRSFQTSLGNTSHYLDVGFKPLYPFGYGLSYTTFSYSDLQISDPEIGSDENIVIRFRLVNTGNFDGEEVAQLYFRDPVASVTRPVKELIRFRRVSLKAGEEKVLQFTLSAEELGFYDKGGNYHIEPGEFKIWVGGSSDAELSSTFQLVNKN